MTNALSGSSKRNLIISSIVIAVICGGLSYSKPAYLKLLSAQGDHKESYTVLAEYTSMFGNIKIAEVRSKEENTVIDKIFLQDGLIQNRALLDNTSNSMYTHVLDALSRSFQPQAKTAVILGLGAGAVPMSFKKTGIGVTVVEINPMALKAAEDHFGFDASGMDMRLEDARTFVRTCRDKFDIAVVDLFLGDNIPDYLPTLEFFRDLEKCLNATGSVVMNAFFDDHSEENNKRLLATIGTSFPKMYLAGIDGGNIFIIGNKGPTPKKLYVPKQGIPKQIGTLVRQAISQTHRVPPKFYLGAKPITDDHNIFSVLFADANMIERQFLAKSVPSDLLIN